MGHGGAGAPTRAGRAPIRLQFESVPRKINQHRVQIFFPGITRKIPVWKNGKFSQRTSFTRMWKQWPQRISDNRRQFDFRRFQAGSFICWEGLLSSDTISFAYQVMMKRIKWFFGLCHHAGNGNGHLRSLLLPRGPGGFNFEQLNKYVILLYSLPFPVGYSHTS